MSVKNQKGTETRPFKSHDLFGTMRLDSDDNNQDKRNESKAFLNVIRSEADLGVHVFVESPTVLGRDPDCGFPLHDFGVSRQHASVTPLDLSLIHI